MQELDNLYNRLFTGDARDMRIASITYGVLKAFVTKAQRTAFCTALKSLNDVVVEGAACLEGGDQQFRLHVQCMLHLRISVADNAEDDLKTYLLGKLNENEVGNVRLFVRVREIGGEVTVDRQIGYVAKDAGKPHFQVLYNKGMTQDILRARGAAYQQVAGNDVFRKKTELKPFGFFSTLTRFEHNELYPLCERMNQFQVARFMILSGKYLLHGCWAAPVGMRTPVRVGARLRKMWIDLRMRKDVDIWDVVCVMTKNEYDPGTEAHDVMEERDAVFDTMSYSEARRKARRAMHRLRNDGGENGEQNLQEDPEEEMEGLRAMGMMGDDSDHDPLESRLGSDMEDADDASMAGSDDVQQDA